MIDKKSSIHVHDWSKHKLCATHGLRYLLIKDFNHPSQTGFCSHPKCVHGLLMNLALHNKRMGYLVSFVWKLEKAAGKDPMEFVTTIVISLLEYCVRFNRPTVLNPTHVRWVCLSYLRSLRREDFKVATRNEITQAINQILENQAEDILHDIDLGIFSSIAGSRYHKGDPEKLYAAKEIIHHFIEKWGQDTYLFAIGELSRLDFCRLKKLSLPQVDDLLKEIKYWYADMVRGELKNTQISEENELKNKQIALTISQ